MPRHDLQEPLPVGKLDVWRILFHVIDGYAETSALRVCIALPYQDPTKLHQQRISIPDPHPDLGLRITEPGGRGKLVGESRDPHHNHCGRCLHELSFQARHPATFDTKVNCGRYLESVGRRKRCNRTSLHSSYPQSAFRKLIRRRLFQISGITLFPEAELIIKQRTFSTYDPPNIFQQ